MNAVLVSCCIIAKALIESITGRGVGLLRDPRFQLKSAADELYDGLRHDGCATVTCLEGV
jgi:hypothetical protein